MKRISLAWLVIQTRIRSFEIPSEVKRTRVKVLLAASFSLGILFNPEDGGDMFLLSVG
jgi:hypothetical protein